MPQSRRPQAHQPGRSWRKWLPWLGLPLALLVTLLVVHAQAQQAPKLNSSNTHHVGPTVDIVPPATVTPTPTETPIPWVGSPVEPPVVYTPKPTVRVAHVETTISPLNATPACLPEDANSFLVSAKITVSNPVGGTVTYHWLSNDGFTSVPLTAVFKPGQTTQTVTDTWTLGAMYANGLPRWEKVVVTGPNALLSNPATFVYRCPAMISDLQVRAVRSADCGGYDVTATVTVFAPAGGSFTYNWMNNDGTDTKTQSKTIIVPPGQFFAQAVATWHIGDASGLPDGVTVTTGTGTVLDTPVANDTPTTTPTPTPTDTPTDTPTCQPVKTPVTVDNLTITDAEATLAPDNLQYNCKLSDTPQQFTYSGQLMVDTSKLTQPGTITYHWVRPDGTSGPDQTLTVNPPDATNADPAHTLVTVPADDPWSQAPNPVDGTYGEQIVITAINGQALETPFISSYGPYWVLCSQPAGQTN